MKRLMTLLLVATAMLTASAQEDPYTQEMNLLDAQYEAIVNEYRAMMKADPKAEQPLTRARIVQMSQAVDSIGELQLALVYRIIRENKNNQIPVPYIRDYMYALGYDGLTEALDPKAAYYDSPELRKAKQLLASYAKRAPGMMFHDLTMQDQSGKEVKLSQWVTGTAQPSGKRYVLVDFWATWCGPCRQEMPNIIANYEKYHAKGFEVVGVSFDKDKQAWVDGVRQLGLRWPQMSDLKGWQCAAAPLYGISSIPASVLLDAEGRIIAVDLRGKKLGAKLRELYGE